MRLAGDLACIREVNKEPKTQRVGGRLMVYDLVHSLVAAVCRHYSYTSPMSEIVVRTSSRSRRDRPRRGCIKLCVVRIRQDSPNFKYITGAGGTTGIICEMTITRLVLLRKYEVWSWPIVPTLRHRLPSPATLVYRCGTVLNTSGSLGRRMQL